MNTKIAGLFLCASLTVPMIASSADFKTVRDVGVMIGKGEVNTIASLALSTLPKSVIESLPSGFVTYNALRFKVSHSNGQGHGWGGGHGGGRGHKC